MTKKYKIRTHKSTAKRFRMSGSGKILRTKGGKTHFRRRRSFRSKNMLSKSITLTHFRSIRRIKRLAPYMKLYKTHAPM
ncbi:MAG: 50S ribosomal protein L35 [Anaerolineae bacterium]